jgi:hypothetical protein
MKIYTPVKDFNGVRQGVRFVNGVGETDNMLKVSWFQQHGYQVVDESHTVVVEKKREEIPQEVVTTTDDEVELMGYSEKPASQPDFEAMNPNELREWAKANGLGGVIKNTRSKEKLLELIRG